MLTELLVEGRPAPDSGGRAARPGWIAVTLWAVLIAGAFAVGHILRTAGLATEDRLPPLHAQARILAWQMLPAVATAALITAVLPSLVRRLRWPFMLLTGWAAAVIWAMALAVADGPGALARPLNAPTEYPAGLSAVRPDPLRWLQTFTEQLAGYPTHVRGHPPLPTLVLWGLEAGGLGGTGWAAAMIIAVGGSAVAAIAITLRWVADEQTARRAVPFLVLAPLALWIATAMDAFFLGVAAWATALLAIAARHRRTLCAFCGGLLLGTLPYLNYGLLPLFAVPFVVLLMIRPDRRVVAAALFGLAVAPVAFTLAGFWWPDGVTATLDTYLVSGGSARRSYAYFLIGDLAVLGLLVGPAVAYVLPSTLTTLWPTLRRRAHPTPATRATLLAGAAVAGTLALDVSGVTRGEVERIWVPYAAWIIVTTTGHRPPARRWLAAQALTAIAVQALVLSEW